LSKEKKEQKTLSSPAASSPPRSRAPFPGGADAGLDSVLRVAIDREPLANIVSHGGSSPDLEVCGVLVGIVGEDVRGEYIHVKAVIRGEQAREQSAHVTFTHETWNHIHAEMDKQHPGLQIVGWYHTHPGFDVFLSEMDQFIHQNFFGQSHQVALVLDPLGGKTALFTLRDGKPVPLRSYWREDRTVVLDAPGVQGEEGGPDLRVSQALATLRESLAKLERRLDQPPRRSWTEEWVVPILLIAVLTVLVLNTFFTPRERHPTPEMAQLFQVLLQYQEEGIIRVEDDRGNQVRLRDLLLQALGESAPAPREAARAPAGAGSPAAPRQGLMPQSPGAVVPSPPPTSAPKSPPRR
jgi:proteasome lid subunit RPN8/RPN11